MIVIADTTPLNYLVLIDQIQILPELFGQVVIPPLQDGLALLYYAGRPNGHRTAVRIVERSIGRPCFSQPPILAVQHA